MRYYTRRERGKVKGVFGNGKWVGWWRKQDETWKVSLAFYFPQMKSEDNVFWLRKSAYFGGKFEERKTEWVMRIDR